MLALFLLLMGNRTGFIKNINSEAHFCMADKHKGEREPGSRYRHCRFFHSLDQWYFLTREGTVEGPFRHRSHAEKGLDTYIRTQNGVSS